MLRPEENGGAVTAPLLEVRGLKKVYGGTAALAGIDLTVGRGEIHALLGENGAGKSTLVRVLAAVEQQDGGTISLGGEPLPPARTPQSMSERGVVFIHQDLGLVASMSVAENIAQYAGFVTGALGIDWDGTRQRARAALARLEVDLDPDALVGELSIAEQATVAIARALALDARLVVLDEPTASLAAGEAQRLLAILHRLRETGVSCILVTHRLDEVLTHCDRVTVLRNGALAGTGPVRRLSRDQLVELIVGETADSPVRAAATRRAGSRLRLAGVRGPGFGPIDLDVAPGEIVAVTGLADGGHLTLADALFGAADLHGGTVWLDDEPYRPTTPAAALRAGVSAVPRDRNALGLAGALCARENLFANPAERGLRPLDLRRERTLADELLEAFDVRPRNAEAAIATFSGGNAQKVLIARTLVCEPRVLLLSEPTAGVDIGARASIYATLRGACANGLSIVVASSDFEEVEELADRTAVLYRGGLVDVLDRPETTVGALTEAAYGTTRSRA